MDPAGAVGRPLAVGRGLAGPLGHATRAQSRGSISERATTPGRRGGPRGRSPDRSGLAQSSRSPGPVADPPRGRRLGRTPTTDLPKNANHAAGVTDPRSALRSQCPARERNTQEWRATETVLRNRGMAQPMALRVAVRAVYGSAAAQSATWRSLGHPARSGHHACVPKSHPAIGETALGAPTNKPRSIEAGDNSGEGSGCLRGHGPGRAVTPAHRWGRAPPGWLDGDSPRQSPANPSTPSTRG